MAIITIVPTSPCSAKHSDNSTAKNPSRSVCFDETKNVFYRNTQWCKKVAKNSWYSPQDFKAMKDTCIYNARSVYNKEKDCEEDDTYSVVILRVYKHCMNATAEKETQLPREDKRALRKTLRKWTNRVGLEKLCIAGIGFDKKSRRVDLPKRILACQATYMDRPAQERAELIRATSLSITRTSRLFSEYIASVSKMDQ